MPDAPLKNDAPEARLLRHCMVPDHERRNGSLRALLLDMADHVPDRKTNRPSGESYFVNKWLSAPNLHLLPDPGIKSLVTLIEKAVNGLSWPGEKDPGGFRIHSMWAIISRSGMEGKPHRHAGRVSGAYYVEADACDGAGSGAFAIYTPQRQIAKLITPKSGMMLLFPSNMWHGVLRYESDLPRIVLSFNLA